MTIIISISNICSLRIGNDYYFALLILIVTYCPWLRFKLLTDFRDTSQEDPAGDDERASDTREIHHGNMIAVHFMFLMGMASCVIPGIVGRRRCDGCRMDGVGVY